MRTTLALKIFLSFWLIHAVIFVVLAIENDPGASARAIDRARHDGEIAAALLERNGPSACVEFLRAVEQQGTRTALMSADGRAVCSVQPVPSDRAYQDLVARANSQGTADEIHGLETTAVAVKAAGGREYKAVASQLPGARPRRRPFPYTLLVTSIIVSGIVCLLLAAYLARPLNRLRVATHRLREGDLAARAGTGLRARRDEIGDVVRDFDAMAERIELLVNAQRQLLSDISHELRSPLARLNVALELARRTAGEGAEPHLARIEGEADRMNELIGRLLALARAESDGAATYAEEFDLGEVVQQVADDAQYEAQRLGKTVAAEVRGEARLRGDPVLISSAIENVVRNAIKYAPTNSTVEVVSGVEDGQARVVVRDYGEGVPEAELERVFLPFHRVDESRDRKSGGTGLGLSIARRAVTSQGGTIRAENAAGGGLQVTITLPIAEIARS